MKGMDGLWKEGWVMKGMDGLWREWIGHEENLRLECNEVRKCNKRKPEFVYVNVIISKQIITMNKKNCVYVCEASLE